MSPYEILGIEKNATEEEIKKAYRDLSKIHHPDAGGESEDFKRIAEAYKLLSDHSSREHYDQYGFGPESEEAKRMVIVMNSLCTVWDNIASSLTPKQLERYDLIGIMKTAVKKKIVQQESTVEETKQVLDRIEKLVKVIEERLERKPSKKPLPNFFLETLKKRMAITKGELKDHLYSLDIAKEMHDIICEYDFKFDSDGDPFADAFHGRKFLGTMDGRGNFLKGFTF